MNEQTFVGVATGQAAQGGQEHRDDRFDVSRRGPGRRPSGGAVGSPADGRRAGHRVLDTGPEEAFDDLADLVATITGCERAFITLVDEDRSFWKSCVGVDIRKAGGRQLRRPGELLLFPGRAG